MKIILLGAPVPSGPTLLEKHDVASDGSLSTDALAASSASETPEVAADRFAAIDIGSNSVRIVIAQAEAGGYRVLDEERENTRLASSLAETGALSQEAVESSITALKSFVTIARGYAVREVRAIATSAVRDASNGPDFCRRVSEEVGIEVVVISAHQEGRLSFLSVARAFDVSDKPVAVADIGGGSTEIVLATEGIVEAVLTTRLGAVRVAERCGLAGMCDGPRLEAAETFIDQELRRGAKKPPLVPAMLYGAGGTFTAMASMLAAREKSGEEASVRGYRANRADVRHLTADLAKLTLEERGKVAGLNPRRADIIVAGLLVIDRIMRHLKVNVVQVHTGGVRDGLLLTMIEAASAGGRPIAPDEREAAVERFAERCGVDLPHAKQVAWIARRLLAQLAVPLGLNETDTPLISAAAILANVGYLINFDQHHKHSYQLIRNSDLPGFERDELRLVANIARYHRGARPKQKHKPFAALSDEDQDRVAKLAAILRVALALDRTHQQQVQDLRVGVTENRVEITVRTSGDAEMDLWAARRKVDLFERVSGRRVYFAAVGE
ncbi:Ppx/GppA phosphatase family protein [Botrimarina hoheduenensis]|uniref:Ppx/GppA phosphatase family protein n=1 Tax=Botrimarina hoheduenensis TaxID=2528000 RepID=UPI0018D38A04|nr:Ppx/GppA phosphatase family protein [Botrimarina hoheduenensis]